MNCPEKVFRERQKNYNKVKGGNYHESFRNYHSCCGVGLSVRGRRLLLEKTTVGVVSHILTLYIGVMPHPFAQATGCILRLLSSSFAEHYL